MAKREVEGGGEVAVTDRPAQRRPRMVVALGRGKVGKSVFLTWLAESSARRYPLRIVDADPNNPVLVRRFSDAIAPEGDGPEERRMWLEREFERLIERAGTADQEDMLLDVGGNDHLLKRMGGEMKLAELLIENGVDPVAVHLVGPDEADLRYLEDVESRGLFCPPMTVLVLNEGLVSSGRDPLKVYETILRSEVVRNVTSPARGGKLVFMPELACLREIEAAGSTPGRAVTGWREINLGLFNRTRVSAVDARADAGHEGGVGGVFAVGHVEAFPGFFFMSKSFGNSP